MSDLIDRQAAITLPVMPKEHREYQTYNLDDVYEQGWFDLQKCIEELPSAQPEPTLEQIEEYCRKRCLVIMTSELYNYMTSRWSSAQPERKKGKWITNFYAFGEDRYECDQCRNTALHLYDFCPNCGSDMRGEQE